MADPLDFNFDYTFENEIVKVCPLEVKHIKELQNISKNESIWTYFLEKGNGGVSLEKYCFEAIKNRHQNKEYPFVIFDKRTNKYAGMTRIYDYNIVLGTIKMGHTWLGRKYWGTKLNKHSKYLLFKFIFNELNLERIGFGVHSQNLRSANALKSIGCEKEGILRSFLPNLLNTGRVDLLLFSLLKTDWFSKTEADLKQKLV